MCYAIPGKIIKKYKNLVVIDYFGERRNARNDFEQVKVGDYVYAQGGFVVDKVATVDGKAILKEWRKKFFILKKIDQKLSTGEEKFFPSTSVKKIIQRVLQNIPPTKEEIITLLKITDKNQLHLLYQTANFLRKKNLDNACCVHGIIEFSNFCCNNCLYCGIRCANIQLSRYRMSVEEIVNTATNAVNKLGFKALVLQSGEDNWYTTEKLVEIITKIRKKCGVLLFMSIGNRPLECYQKMYKAGARGILMRFESSHPSLFQKIHLSQISSIKTVRNTFEERLKILHYSQKLGYLIVTGSIIGVPGQTKEDIVNDILLTHKLKAEMYSFGPLIPHPQTPFAKTPLVKLDEMLKVLAITRLVDPKAKILVTTALETLDKKNGKRLGLLSGANSLMINVTPSIYRKKYTIYPGRPDKDKAITQNIKETLDLLYAIGRAPTDLGI